MIHDFAKSPRHYQFEPGRPVAQPRRRIPVPRIRWVALLLAVLAVIFWRTHTSSIEPEAEYTPGKTESTEYQEALEQQAQEKVAAEAASLAKEAALAKKAEQKRLAAELKERMANTASTEPEFGFYDSLAGSSWTVPVQKGIYVTEEDRKRANQRYMLQAASVRDGSEAQRIVQRLRQLGLQAFYSHDESGGWYRINVGPFDNVSKMNKAEDILVSLRMMPLKRRL